MRVDEIHTGLLRQAIELARQARQAGNHPFGALLALNGAVLLTAQNTIATDRDPTAHAESNLVAAAIRQLAPCQHDDLSESYSGDSADSYGGVSMDARWRQE